MTSSAGGEPEVGADEVDVGAEQVEPDAEDQPARNRPQRRVDSAEYRCREGVDEDRLHHARVEEDRGRRQQPGDRTEHGGQPPAETRASR